MQKWEEKVLIEFTKNPADFWTVDDAMMGISIIGGTGGGKTTGSGRTIALKYLKEGWGGLVLCAKTEEVKLWKQYCKEANREKDLIIFGKNSAHESGEHKGKIIEFNPMHYETTREGEGRGESFNLTNIFMNLNKVRNRASNEGEGRKDDAFWDNALKRIISRTIELITEAGEELTFKNMIELIYTAPKQNTPIDKLLFEAFSRMVRYEDEHKEALDENFFLKCLAKAFNKVLDARMENSANGIVDFKDDISYTYDSIDRYFTSSAIPQLI